MIDLHVHTLASDGGGRPSRPALSGSVGLRRRPVAVSIVTGRSDLDTGA
jgi:hypothetical protein